MLKKKIEKVLLVNPPYTFNTYLDIDRRAGTMQNPVISLASLAGSLKNVCEAKILDLDILENNQNRVLAEEISRFKPDLVGITATTPVFPSLLDTAHRVKEIDKEILVVAGGVHVTALPADALNSEDIDIAVVGEADFFIKDLVESGDRQSLRGAYFKSNGDIIFHGRSDLIADLDTLPYPQWGLYDLAKYRASRLIESHSPGGLLETSRGCPFRCSYCNNTVFGFIWRKKSVDRVLSEFRYMKDLGFKELHIEDDGFSTDLKRAKVICQKIIETKVEIPWTLVNGIRVDRVDQELFELLKEAGCYQVAFGIESGDEEVLRRINKGITQKQTETAVRLANKAGLETFGFFMFGLPGETEESMQKTIDLAKRLPLTLAKFAITIPYPGTPLFEKLEAEGKILHKNWEKYLLHNNRSPIFIHSSPDWETIQRYYKKAYREFYFRPSQVFTQFVSSLKNGTLLEKIRLLLKTKWF